MSNAKPLIMALRDVAVTYTPDKPRKFAFERRGIGSERGMKFFGLTMPGNEQSGLITPGNELVLLSRKEESKVLTFDHSFISGPCLPFQAGKSKNGRGFEHYSLLEAQEELNAALQKANWHVNEMPIHTSNPPMEIFREDIPVSELPRSLSFSLGYAKAHAIYEAERGGRLHYGTAQGMVDMAQHYADKLLKKAAGMLPSEITLETLIGFLKGQGFDVFEQK